MPQTKIQIIDSPEQFTPDKTELSLKLSVPETIQIIASGKQIQGYPVPITSGPFAGKYSTKPLEDSSVVSILDSKILANLSSGDIEKLLSNFFKDIKQHIETQFPINKYKSCGATFTVALQTNTAIYTAYVGDSELFAITIERPGDKPPIVQVHRLTEFLHHVAVSQEQHRIFEEGGTLIGSRLAIPDKHEAPLALSRTICNAPLAPHPNAILGLSSIPTIVTLKLEPIQQETIMLACSDGFIEGLGGEEACLKKLHRYFSNLTQTNPSIGELTNISEKLLALSDPQWLKGPRDDTTVVCVSTIKPKKINNNFVTLAIVADEYGGTYRVAKEITRVAQELFTATLFNQLQTRIEILNTAFFETHRDSEFPPTQPLATPTPPIPHDMDVDSDTDAVSDSERKKKNKACTSHKRKRETDVGPELESAPAAKAPKPMRPFVSAFFKLGESDNPQTQHHKIEDTAAALQ